VKTLKKHQISFVDAQEQYVGLFGGVGNGKTYIACLKVIELATKYPKNLCLVGRLTYPELRDSTREVFLSALAECYPPEAYTLNKSENSVTFWNESVVIFRHLDETANILSMNLGAFYIDQAEEVDEDVFLILQSRLRRQGIKELKGLITGNPKGFNWVYYKFGMDQAGEETDHQHKERYRMITAPTIANAENLPQDYIAQLQESYSPEWYARYVMGSWDAFEGQIFDLTKITGYETLPELIYIVTACDPAISKEKTACNTAFSTIGVGKDGHFYDLETIAGKWSFLETLEEARKVLGRQRSDYLGVESVAYQKALVEACTRYFPNITVVDLKADKDKFRRAKSVSHIVGKGLYHTNNRELLNEISAFVPDADGKERKDRVDALVHALHMVQMYAPDHIAVGAPVKKETSHEWFYRMASQQEREGETSQEELYDKGYSGPSNPDFF